MGRLEHVCEVGRGLVMESCMCVFNCESISEPTSRTGVMWSRER